MECFLIKAYEMDVIWFTMQISWSLGDSKRPRFSILTAYFIYFFADFDK